MAYKCFCNNYHNCKENTCFSKYGCFALRIGSDRIIMKVGCLQNTYDITNICYNTTIIKSCCQRNFCNNNLTAPVDSPAFYDDNYIYQLLIKVFVPISMFILIICIVLIYKYHHQISKYLKLYSGLSTNSARPQCVMLDQDSDYKSYIDQIDSSLSQNNSSRFIDNYSGLLPLNEGQFCPETKEIQCNSCTSGSGSGMPFLVQRTIARQVQLIAGIGKGRFGEVWRGEYYGESVAVKIFSSRDETSWARETHIYNTFLLRHPNILGYYASDMVSRYGCTQLWLITHYHSLGSLYDFLHSASFNSENCLRLLHSIAAGLAHLHTEIVTGPHGKPKIAHRDLKSKNILMIDENTACIADLGLSVLQSPSSSSQCGCPFSKHKVGTKRYMSPEILAECLCPDIDDSLDVDDFSNLNPNVYRSDCPIIFDHFISSDVYSLALVMWEVLSRTKSSSEIVPAHDYKVPFHEHLPLDPSTLEMKKIVCIDKVRPSLTDNSEPRMGSLVSLVKECWSEKSHSRPTALRIKKNLKSLLYDRR